MLMRDRGKKGLPATAQALKAYAQRVLRPGQVQSFGMVMLIGSKDSASLTGASPGTILAVSANCEDHVGIRADDLLAGLDTAYYCLF